MTKDNSWGPFILGIIFGLGILVVVDLVYGNYLSPIDKLNLDKDQLAKDYIVKYYPEFKNCSMIYIDSLCNDGTSGCMNSISGVNVYCGGLGSRDGLQLANVQTITQTILFKDVTLDKILKDKLKELK